MDRRDDWLDQSSLDSAKPNGRRGRDWKDSGIFCWPSRRLTSSLDVDKALRGMKELYCNNSNDTNAEIR